MFVLYLVKTGNDFYGIQYSIKCTRHRTSLPKTWPESSWL